MTSPPCDQLPYIYVFFNHFVVILVDGLFVMPCPTPADCRVSPVPLFSGPRGGRTAKDALALVWCVICVMVRNQPIVAQKQLPRRPISGLANLPTAQPRNIIRFKA
jgi:hypothetical protein